MTLAGAVLSTRELIKRGLTSDLDVKVVIDGGTIGPATPEELAARAEDRRTELATRLGFGMVVLGTIIWGYGDLLGGLPQ